MNKMTIVEALRTILYEDGLETLLDYQKLCGKLWDLASTEDTQRKNFQALYETGAMDSIHEAMMDAAQYERFFANAVETLCKIENMTISDAKSTVDFFYEALGYPSEKPVENPQTIREEDCLYVGEVKDGKRHGRGKEILYYHGKPFNTREGLWLHDDIFGFLFSIDDMNVKEYCFCIKSHMIGKETHIWQDGEVYVDEHSYL